MDVRLINPFIESTQQVLLMMAGTKVVADSPRASAHVEFFPDNINVIVEMSGGVTGALLLRIPKTVAIKLATSFTGTTMPLEDTHDAIGELGNMITGSAKQNLKSQLVNITIPRIALKQEDLGSVADLTPWLEVPFIGSVGEFSICVSISEVKSFVAA